MASAAYWWVREFAAVGRAALFMVGRAQLFQLIYVDDLEWPAQGALALDDVLLLIFLYVVIGVPFAWRVSSKAD